jgi:RecA-family ATPase
MDAKEVDTTIASILKAEKAKQKGVIVKPSYKIKKCLSFEDIWNSPLREYKWLINDSFLRAKVGAIFGVPGCGKSVFIAGFLLALGAGRKAYGQWEPKEKVRSVVFTAEDDEDQVINRYQNIARGMGLNDEEIDAIDIKIYPLDGAEIRLTRQEGRNILVNEENYDWFREQVRVHLPHVTILDTLSQFLGGDENINDVATETCSLLGQICSEYNSNIILVHHTHKGAGDIIRDEKKLRETLSQTSLRGASAWIGYLRWALMLAPLATKLTQKLLNDESLVGEDGKYVAAKVIKKNMGYNEPIIILEKLLDEMGMARVYQVTNEEGDSLENDKNYLVGEVARNPGEMKLSNYFRLVSWSQKRGKRALDLALEQELLELKKIGNITYLRVAGEVFPGEDD